MHVSPICYGSLSHIVALPWNQQMIFHIVRKSSGQNHNYTEHVAEAYTSSTRNDDIVCKQT